MRELTLGRIVRYRCATDRVLPAMVTEIVQEEQGLVNLVVFGELWVGTGSPAANITMHVLPGDKPGTWHWPETQRS